jgi:hypothetical protein
MSGCVLLLVPLCPSVSIDLVGLTTFDPWVGNLKFWWLDILKFEGLEFGPNLRPLF